MLLQRLRQLTPWLAVDWFLSFAAFSSAYLLRFLDGHPVSGYAAFDRFAAPAALAAGLFALVNVAFGVHRRVWRYAPGSDSLVIAVAILVACSLALIWDVVASSPSAGRPIPLSVLLIGTFFSGFGFTLVRYRSRFAFALPRFWHGSDGAAAEPNRAVVYGAGEVGQLLVRRLRTHAAGGNYRVVAFIDDDRSKHGMLVHGIPVRGGRERLQGVIESERADVLLIAMGHTQGPDMRHILALAQETNAQIKVADDVMHWVDDRYSVSLLRDMRPEDLIGRSPVTPDVARCGHLIASRVVMVTGACGSIGSEMVRQLVRLDPQRIVAFDNNESGLFDLAIEIRALVPGVELRLVVGDVTSHDEFDEVVRRERPAIIFHVAAYKHVGLMELHPSEAIRTNISGTWVVATVAERHQVANLVLVSTDKAVNPSSVMGATKRLAEELVQHKSKKYRASGSGPITTIVRFGNVLGSRGSVIPTFEKQIALGGPVTVTDPAVTRFFMHTAEAASLTIEAAALGSTGDLFMLDMGERIRIDDLARKMIRMRGLRPRIDIPIVYTGLGQGEKLHEELIYSHEQRTSTSHPRIFCVAAEDGTAERGGQVVDLIERHVNGVIDRHALMAGLADLVDGVLAPWRIAAAQAAKDTEVVGRSPSLAAEEPRAGSSYPSGLIHSPAVH